MSHEMTTHITDNLPQIAKEEIPEKVTIEYVIKKNFNFKCQVLLLRSYKKNPTCVTMHGNSVKQLHMLVSLTCSLYSPNYFYMKNVYLQSVMHEKNVFLQQMTWQTAFQKGNHVPLHPTGQQPFTCSPCTSKCSSRSQYFPLHFAPFGSNFTTAQLSFEALPRRGCLRMKSAWPQGLIVKGQNPGSI